MPNYPNTLRKRKSTKKNELSDEMKMCKSIIEDLLSKKHSNYASPFYKPVDSSVEGFEDYYDKILTPMDLGTVKRKIKKRQYKTVRDFVNDVRLIFQNCSNYNSDHNLIVKARKLKLAFKRSYRWTSLERKDFIDSEEEQDIKIGNMEYEIRLLADVARKVNDEMESKVIAAMTEEKPTTDSSSQSSIPMQETPMITPPNSPSAYDRNRKPPKRKSARKNLHNSGDSPVNKQKCVRDSPPPFMPELKKDPSSLYMENIMQLKNPVDIDVEVCSLSSNEETD